MVGAVKSGDELEQERKEIERGEVTEQRGDGRTCAAERAGR